MVKEGYYFGIPLLTLGVAAYFLHWTIAAAMLFLLGVFCFSFFRDPERIIPSDPGAIVAPGESSWLPTSLMAGAPASASASFSPCGMCT